MKHRSIMMQIICIILLSTAIAAKRCENAEDDHCMALDSPENSFNQETDWKLATNVYQFHAKDIHGNDVLLKKYNGNVLIVVNVASQCGLTDSNYKKLVELYEKYYDKGLRILAFPSNQFWKQEPGTSEDIINFSKSYHVNFDMFEKVDVNGADAHPLWKWLTTDKNGDTVAVSWNFVKFVINREGKIVQRFDPSFIFNSDLTSMEKLLSEMMDQ